MASIMRDRVPGSWRTRCGSLLCNPTGMGREILNPDGGPNTNHTTETRKLATDIVMNVGEALVGEGNAEIHLAVSVR